MKTDNFIKAHQILSDECGYTSPGIMELHDDITVDEALKAMFKFAEYYHQQKMGEVEKELGSTDNTFELWHDGGEWMVSRDGDPTDKAFK